MTLDLNIHRLSDKSDKLSDINMKCIVQCSTLKKKKSSITQKNSIMKKKNKAKDPPPNHPCAASASCWPTGRTFVSVYVKTREKQKCHKQEESERGTHFSQWFSFKMRINPPHRTIKRIKKVTEFRPSTDICHFVCFLAVNMDFDPCLCSPPIRNSD